MKVTSLDLLNHLRCRRYSALHASLREEEFFDESLLSEAFSLEAESSDSISEENYERRNALNMDYIHPSELLSTYIEIAHPNITPLTNQIFERQFEHQFQLKTKVDLMESTPSGMTFYKVNPSSASHYLNIKYTYDKRKFSLFEKGLDLVYYPRIEYFNETTKTNYFEKLKRCMSRHYDTGRIVYDLAFQEFVLSKQFLNIKRRYVLSLLNPDFRLEVDSQTEKPKYDERLFVHFDLTALVTRLQDKIQADLYRMINHIELNDDSRCTLVKKECLRGEAFSCEYCDYCYSHVPEENSIFTYFYSHQGFKEGPRKNDIVHDTYDLLNEGMVDMLDIPISWLQREKNLMQRYCVENDYTYVNAKKITHYLTNLVYPLYYLDFEAYPSPLPRFFGESPYSQSVFQYSLHIQKKRSGSSIIHEEYLAPDLKDHRRELVEKLCRDIPPGESSIVVYNSTYEKTRLQEFQNLFPEYKDRLDEMQARLFDLMKLLKNDSHFFLNSGYSPEEADTYNFYHPQQNGSYSIKKILKAFGEEAYEKMRVQNGVMAYKLYLELDKLTKEAKSEAINALKKYCEQDTYSMVYILDKIIHLVE